MRSSYFSFFFIDLIFFKHNEDISYIISFLYVGIYWNNHHHLFQIVRNVNGKILWANLIFLFCLSLIPFATDWMGEFHFAENTVAFYGIVLILSAASFNLIQYFALKNEGEDSPLAHALQQKTKEYVSHILYILGLGISSFYPKISLLLYFIVAVMWLIPDRRVEENID